MATRFRIDRPSTGAATGGGNVSTALRVLLQAFDYATELKCSIWEFAVEFRALEADGVHVSDLRWLLAAGYADHGMDQTRPGAKCRQFRHVRHLTFSDTSCCVLTDRGVSFARNSLGKPLRLARHGNTDHDGDGRAWRYKSPTWDASRRVRLLLLGATLVKSFTRPAPDQETVLAAFEAQGWPSEIDDPLPTIRGKRSKRRHHNTINRLNQGQVNKLLHFYSAGRGQRIAWRLIL